MKLLNEVAEAVYTTIQRPNDPAAPPWSDLRDDEKLRWTAVAHGFFQSFFEEVGIPLLKNGAGRTYYLPDSNELVVVVTESLPVTLIAVDNGLALQIGRPSSPQGEHSSFSKVSVRRIEPATHSLEEDFGLPMPEIPAGRQ